MLVLGGFVFLRFQRVSIFPCFGPFQFISSFGPFRFLCECRAFSIFVKFLPVNTFCEFQVLSIVLRVWDISIFGSCWSFLFLPVSGGFEFYAFRVAWIFFSSDS